MAGRDRRPRALPDREGGTRRVSGGADRRGVAPPTPPGASRHPPRFGEGSQDPVAAQTGTTCRAAPAGAPFGPQPAASSMAVRRSAPPRRMRRRSGSAARAAMNQPARSAATSGTLCAGQNATVVAITREPDPEARRRPASRREAGNPSPGRGGWRPKGVGWGDRDGCDVTGKPFTPPGATRHPPRVGEGSPTRIERHVGPDIAERQATAVRYRETELGRQPARPASATSLFSSAATIGRMSSSASGSSPASGLIMTLRRVSAPTSGSSRPKRSSASVKPGATRRSPRGSAGWHGS